MRTQAIVENQPVSVEILDEKDGLFGKTTWRFMNTEEPDPNKYDVVFRDVESYAQYLADEFGSVVREEGKPDARIFYEDGRVVEIFPNTN